MKIPVFNDFWLKCYPIPNISTDQQQPIITLVNKILSAKNKNPAENTTKWERKIDALVYELYGLTDSEIAMIEK